MPKVQNYYVRGTLEVIARLDASPMGNPTYLLRIGDIFCRTQRDSMQAYGVTNYRNQTVTATLVDGKSGPELVYIQ